MTQNYEIQNDEIKATMREIGRKIDEPLPDGWGFMLMIYEFGTVENPGANFYISKGSREDTIRMLKEWIARQETSAPSMGELDHWTKQP